MPLAHGREDGMGKRFAIVIGVAAAGAMAFAAPASATTDTFDTVGTHTWTVPAGVTSATFDLYGARGGGTVGDSLFAPGLGGEATATIAVTPGDSIEVNVGGQGGSPAGGFNGGGAGGRGGGGASDIRIGGTAFADRMLVAGGGGGGGEVSCPSQPVFGGDGGGESGDAGLASTAGICSGSVAGGGGKQDTGGTATAPATPGGVGVGGDGGTGIAAGGGGGGGGWYGGGGGLNAAGGGGGSGHGPVGTTFQTGVRDGNGLVTVTYTGPATIADLIDSVEALNLSSKVEDGLVKTLTGAQNQLDAGDTHKACKKLTDFIGEVSKQSGKAIATADANDLIDEAEAVRESLGCA